MSYFNGHENEVLDAQLGDGHTLLGTPVEIGLSTTTPADDGTNITEPVGNGYARASVDNTTANWGDAAAGVKSNAAEITFPAASGGGWGTVTHWILYSGGVAKIWGVLDDGTGTPLPVEIEDGDTPRFQVGQLRIELD